MVDEDRRELNVGVELSGSESEIVERLLEDPALRAHGGMDAEDTAAADRVLEKLRSAWRNSHGIDIEAARR